MRYNSKDMVLHILVIIMGLLLSKYSSMDIIKKM